MKKILIPQFIQSSPPYISNMTFWFGLWFVWMKILKNNKQKWTNIYKVNIMSTCIVYSTIRKCWIFISTKFLVWATNYFNSKLVIICHLIIYRKLLFSSDLISLKSFGRSAKVWIFVLWTSMPNCLCMIDQWKIMFLMLQEACNILFPLNLKKNLQINIIIKVI